MVANSRATARASASVAAFVAFAPLIVAGFVVVAGLDTTTGADGADDVGTLSVVGCWRTVVSDAVPFAFSGEGAPTAAMTDLVASMVSIDEVLGSRRAC
jgi:hypothetical protein